ncbi:MAG: ABC transporter ATP-binding protein, partial [Thermodesulfobacteriota bacterium]
YGEGDAKVEAIKGVDFIIQEAEFAAFAGPSGSGKTTLLNLVGCLDRPTGGKLFVAGEDVSRLSWRQRARFRGENIGFVFQNFNLIAVLTAFENVEYPLCMVKSVSPEARRQKVLELLEAVGMLEHKDRRPDQLSGGQKQRVAIARALVTEPKLVLADEPTANLDKETSRTIIGLMKRLREQTGTAFVFSTHDARLLGEVDRIFTLEDGRLNGPIDSQGGSHVEHI